MTQVMNIKEVDKIDLEAIKDNQEMKLMLIMKTKMIMIQKRNRKIERKLKINK